MLRNLKRVMPCIAVAVAASACLAAVLQTDLPQFPHTSVADAVGIDPQSEFPLILWLPLAFVALYDIVWQLLQLRRTAASRDNSLASPAFPPKPARPRISLMHSNRRPPSRL